MRTFKLTLTAGLTVGIHTRQPQQIFTYGFRTFARLFAAVIYCRYSVRVSTSDLLIEQSQRGFTNIHIMHSTRTSTADIQSDHSHRELKAGINDGHYQGTFTDRIQCGHSRRHPKWTFTTGTHSGHTTRLFKRPSTTAIREFLQSHRSRLPSRSRSRVRSVR